MKTVYLTTITVQNLTFKQAIALGLFYDFFRANREFVLSEEAVSAVKKIKNNRNKRAILAIDTYRKERQELQSNAYYATDSEALTKSYISRYPHTTFFGILYGC